MNTQLNESIQWRRHMIEEQIRRRGVTDERVLQAFEEVPREAFVGRDNLRTAYSDRALSIDCGQTISQPFMVAAMTAALSCTPSDRVLEIGTGSGYQAAILSRLVEQVYTVERIAELQERARATLDQLDYRNIHYRIGDGTLGWPEAAPFHGIVVTAGSPQIPQTLVDQLADGGRLVIPVGGESDQTLTIVQRTGEQIKTYAQFGCRFVKLIGDKGWKE